MKAFFITLLRLLTGRVAFERRARLLALEIAAKTNAPKHELVFWAQEYYYFALYGQSISANDAEVK